ncbi:MAG TPA: VPDSG-CTERM sorting domain-containing protein [Verrucomicrobiota bacterium]|nr:VPDSG-CTERM sorting domain-containing protein [Verrucomicrobiota bacterium]HQB17418.1 VPDSG-CTERM sorting domain-containing protein [Verrucomicrobiota bacterium]
MKKILAATILAGAMAATSVWAIPASGTVYITHEPGYYGAERGELTVTSADPDQAFSFQTFCVERNEYHSSDPNYIYNYQINPDDAAVAGGFGGQDEHGHDPISLGTAYLFSMFTKGTLSGYDYVPGSGRESDAQILQTAIWWLEDEIDLRSPAANAFLGLLWSEKEDWDYWKADANGEYGVKVLNITYSSGGNAQDVLQVPDGGLTLAFLGMGLAGLAGMRRIRK